jgi:hypothetical protein
MRPFDSGAMVLPALLALAPAVAAQDALPVAQAMVPRVELGATAGAAATYPDVGGRVSVVIDRRVSLEFAAAWMPHMWRSPAQVLTQAQVRVPLGPPERSRYGLLAGVSHVRALDRRPGDTGVFGTDDQVTLPHAGASFEWTLGRRTDIRLDTQLLFRTTSDVPVIPRVGVAFVWHPRDGR